MNGLSLLTRGRLCDISTFSDVWRGIRDVSKRGHGEIISYFFWGEEEGTQCNSVEDCILQCSEKLNDLCWQLLKSKKQEGHMPRGARLDTPGTLSYVMRHKTKSSALGGFTVVMRL